MINTIARWILVNIIFAETAVTWGFLTNTFQNNQKTTIATYVHVQDSLATAKIKYLPFVHFKKNGLLIDILDQFRPIKENIPPQLFWDNPNEVKCEFANTKKLMNRLGIKGQE